MSNEEKKIYRELVEFYKTHKWVQQENGRWILVYFPRTKIEEEKYYKTLIATLDRIEREVV